MSVSDYRANANVDPGSQQSNKELLIRPIGADRLQVDAVSTLIPELTQPKRYRWMLLRNFSAFPIWIAYGQAAVVGQGILVPPDDLYFVNPIPSQQVFAIADGGSTNRLYLTAY